jgi:hypothetical protein
MFYAVYRILDELKPNSILELGLGELTKLLQVYRLKMNALATCITVEHDVEWIKFKEKLFLDHKLINIINCELKEINPVKNVNSISYKNLNEEIDKTSNSQKFDLIIIDGPFGSKNYSRYNIIELIENERLNENFIILMDDYERIGEQQTAQSVFDVLQMKGITFEKGVLYGEKNLLIITSSSLKYYTSI